MEKFGIAVAFCVVIYMLGYLLGLGVAYIIRGCWYGF